MNQKEETALTPGTEVYLEELNTWKGSFLSSLQSALHGIEQVETLLRKKASSKSGAVSSAASTTPPERTPVVAEGDVAALQSLKEVGGDFLQKVRGCLGEVVSRHYEMDLSQFFQKGHGVGKLMRSFRSVAPPDFRTALCAFMRGETDRDGVRLYLKVGADVNGLVGGQTAVLQAICADSMEALQMTVEEGGADLEVRAGADADLMLDELTGVPSVLRGDTALVAACRQRRWQMVDYLVEQGADVEATDAQGKKVLCVASEAAFCQLRRLDDDSDVPGNHHTTAPCPPVLKAEDTALRSAVSERLRVLIGKTSDEDLKNMEVRPAGWWVTSSLLHLFVRMRFGNLVELLLDRGVDADTGDWQGLSPLCRAAQGGSLSLMLLLIERGADVQRRVPPGTRLHEGDTVLMAAVRGGFRLAPERMEKVVSILLDRGADVNAQGNRGRSVLHTAVERQAKVETVKFLVEKGADREIRDVHGKTPRDVAVDRNYPKELIAVLS